MEQTGGGVGAQDDVMGEINPVRFVAGLPDCPDGKAGNTRRIASIRRKIPISRFSIFSFITRRQFP